MRIIRLEYAKYSDGSKAWFMVFEIRQVKIMAKQAKELIDIFNLKAGPMIRNGGHIFYEYSIP